MKTTRLRPRKIRYGDNDRLAAHVAQMAGADCLVLLSDIDGLYTADPHNNPDAEHIPEVPLVSGDIEAMAGGPNAGPQTGSGGMRTKLAAARIAQNAGAAVIIARGEGASPLKALEEGARCTLFPPAVTPAAARKSWISGRLNPVGALVVDAGAVDALRRGGSLLPAGVVSITGAFLRGDPVQVMGPDGAAVAQGLSAYDSGDAQLILGRKSHEIEALLGYRGRGVMIHRDDLAIL